MKTWKHGEGPDDHEAGIDFDGLALWQWLLVGLLIAVLFPLGFLLLVVDDVRDKLADVD